MKDYLLFNPLGERVYSKKGEVIADVSWDGRFTLSETPFKNHYQDPYIIREELDSWIDSISGLDWESGFSVVKIHLPFVTQEFSLNESYVEAGFYGMAALYPFLEKINTHFENRLPYREYPKEVHAIFRGSAEGRMLIDLEKRVAKGIRLAYNAAFIYYRRQVDGSIPITTYIKNLADTNLEYEITRGLPQLAQAKKEMPIIPFTPEDENRLDVFAKYLGNIDL